jgi:RimJ/RimL family protein N-acetyltransferase
VDAEDADDGRRPDAHSAPGPSFPALTTLRLVLEPLVIEHADEMVEVLSSPSLYAVIGGGPPALSALRSLYTRQIAGPGRDDEAWVNWVVREGERPVGYVQATLRRVGGRWSAAVAWVVRPEEQRRGLATEAAERMVEQLRSQGVTTVTAWIADVNVASCSVGRRLGLRRTDEVQDGERLWTDQPAVS